MATTSLLAVSLSFRPSAERNASQDSKHEAAIDASLVSRFNEGDEAAFLEIMERHRGRIFGLVQQFLRNSADAEEITQDTFIRAYRGLGRFRGDSSLATWLHRIALNLARNRYWYFFRRRRQDTLSLDKPLGEDESVSLSDFLPGEAQDPRQESVTQEFAGLVAKCMERLDPRHREILIMRNIQNLSYGEISEALRINVGTVKSRIARARENLRKLLAEAAPEYGAALAMTDFFEPVSTPYATPTVACA